MLKKRIQLAKFIASCANRNLYISSLANIFFEDFLKKYAYFFSFVRVRSFVSSENFLFHYSNIIWWLTNKEVP